MQASWIILVLFICGAAGRRVQPQGYRISVYVPDVDESIILERRRQLLRTDEENRQEAECKQIFANIQNNNYSGSVPCYCASYGNIGGGCDDQGGSNSNNGDRTRNRRNRSISQDVLDQSFEVVEEKSGGGGGSSEFPEQSVSGCSEPSTINQLRQKHNAAAISYKADLEEASCALNAQCGFSHSCAIGAEILFSEYGYDEDCHVARSVQGWEKSPGHFQVATGSTYTQFGCCTTTKDGSLVRRCMFS